MKPWILLLLALGACTPASVVVLKNPSTGEVKECSRNSGASFFPIIQTAIDNSAVEDCAKGYTAAGWQRMN